MAPHQDRLPMAARTAFPLSDTPPGLARLRSGSSPTSPPPLPRLLTSRSISEPSASPLSSPPSLRGPNEPTGRQRAPHLLLRGGMIFAHPAAFPGASGMPGSTLQLQNGVSRWRENRVEVAPFRAWAAVGKNNRLTFSIRCIEAAGSSPSRIEPLFPNPARPPRFPDF